jgi:uncharacterized membrane protein
MNVLIWGMILFFGAHLFSMTPLRAPVFAKLGEKAFKGIYSLVSLAGLGLMIWGFTLARSGPDAARIVYDPLMGSSHATMLLVLLAMILLASAHMKGYIRMIVQQPMSAGVALWAAGHLLVNGNLSEVLLFGGFLVLSILDIIVSTARGKVPTHTPQVKYDIMAVVGGVVVYGIFLMSHQWLFGVSPVY